MTTSYTIAYRRDGDGYWYTITGGRLQHTAWRAGEIRYAMDEAERIVDRLQRAERAA